MEVLVGRRQAIGGDRVTRALDFGETRNQHDTRSCSCKFQVSSFKLQY